MNDINQILADCDAKALLQDLDNFEISMRIHVPDYLLFTADGELNVRNRFGAILHHSRMLRSVLSNFFHEGKIG